MCMEGDIQKSQAPYKSLWVLHHTSGDRPRGSLIIALYQEILLPPANDFSASKHPGAFKNNLLIVNGST